MPDPDRSEPQDDKSVLLYILGEPSPFPWTTDELAREMGDSIAAHDAVARLTRAGLVHRLGEFVFPTLTARRAYQIEIGTV